MANLPGDAVHGESITDGNATGGVAVVLYGHGTVTVRALAVDEILYVTDVQIMCQDACDMSLVADGLVAGEYVVHGAVDALDQINIHFQQPRACAVGTGLIFFGGGANISSCLVEGFITKG